MKRNELIEKIEKIKEMLEMDSQDYADKYGIERDTVYAYRTGRAVSMLERLLEEA